MPPKGVQVRQLSAPQVAQSQLSYLPSEQTAAGGESVKVAVRQRPLNPQQLARNDSDCFKTIDPHNCQLVQKNGQAIRNFRFNYISTPKTSQSQLYKSLNIDEYLQSALNGYSVTVFAYGQTGSGKTYTMAGVQDKYTSQTYKADESEGIIPRAIRALWKMAQGKKEKYSIKASYTEIYNEQIKDLLNPSSGVLHCRWNSANGFFVEDQIILDCTSVDDLVAVLREGVRNRRSGTHEMNKDSSRSHSLMTVYVVGQTAESVKRYGKISFVDLAGSQRLKESKSQGEMVKETGNINKSLFTLGKVIKALSDRKTKSPYIPYRDSKLTMLLMDSLGGTSKALMVACVSPSSAYFEQTLSTLNYAARTMNIRNKPVVQMEEKDQIMYGLIRQRDLLRLENQYLREQIGKGGYKKVDLPPLQGNSSPMGSAAKSIPEVSLNNVLHEYEFEMARLQNQNKELRNAREVAEKNHMIVTNDNNALQIKLDNLEELFIRNSNGNRTMNQQYMTSNLRAENKMIKNKIQDLEEEIFTAKANQYESIESKEQKRLNKTLKERIQFMKKRQSQLIAMIKKK